jgi:hypothetical protein
MCALTHCAPYSVGVMHGSIMEALFVSTSCTVVSLFATTKCSESRDAGRRAPSSATREIRPDPVSLVGIEPTALSSACSWPVRTVPK